jgi:hypothetical protein
VIEYLPSKREALNSNPSTAKKNQYFCITYVRSDIPLCWPTVFISSESLVLGHTYYSVLRA